MPLSWKMTNRVVRGGAETYAALVALVEEEEILAHKHYGRTSHMPALTEAKKLIDRMKEEAGDDGKNG